MLRSGSEFWAFGFKREPIYIHSKYRGAIHQMNFILKYSDCENSDQLQLLYRWEKLVGVVVVHHPGRSLLMKPLRAYGGVLSGRSVQS